MHTAYPLNVKQTVIYVTCIVHIDVIIIFTKHMCRLKNKPVQETLAYST